MTAVSKLQDADAATCLIYSQTYPAQVEPLVNVTMVTQCQHDKQISILFLIYSLPNDSSI